MADSLREQIMAAVETRFATISVANGYETTLGAKTFKWRVTDFQEAELPCHNFRDTNEDIDQMVSGVWKHTLKVESVAVAKQPAGMTADKYGRKLLADIWKAIGTDRKWSTLAFDTNPLRDEITIEHEALKLVAVRLEFEILYRTTSFNPYVQA
jgi:hypothetical protein